MAVDLKPIRKCNRLLFKIPLEPLLGKRFQPAGFPSLGAAEFQTGNGRTPVGGVDAEHGEPSRDDNMGHRREGRETGVQWSLARSSNSRRQIPDRQYSGVLIG